MGPKGFCGQQLLTNYLPTKLALSFPFRSPARD